MRILVTGSAGFIGSHVAHVLLDRGGEVVGFDNLNEYYDVALKQARLDRLLARTGYRHISADLADRDAVEGVFAGFRPERVVHLAAQAGVRYAAKNPHVYAVSNLTGFLHLLEDFRHHNVGSNTRPPFDAHRPTDHPLMFCVATKPIPVFNHGRQTLDVAYVDGIVADVVAALDPPATADPAWSKKSPEPPLSSAPWIRGTDFEPSNSKPRPAAVTSGNARCNALNLKRPTAPVWRKSARQLTLLSGQMTAPSQRLAML